MPKKEQTGPQLVGVRQLTDPRLSNRGAKNYATWRKMRRDPTIALARALCIAPVLASDWSVEVTTTAPEGARELISDSLVPLRVHILRSAMLGCIDFGWQGYEKVLAIDGQGRVYLRKLKPLLQDNTDVLVDEATGAYAGLRQYTKTPYLDLLVGDTLLVALDVEGTDWYGQSQMEIAQGSYDRWNAVDASSEKYDRKIAGTHWVIHYPPGTSDVEGTGEKDNYEIAKNILKTLESSSAVIVPRQVERVVDDLNRDAPDAWKIELLTDSGAGSVAYIERQKYLDALKVRAFLVPERAVLEGQYGTRAEAQVHADLAISNMELRHTVLCQLLNWHLVNQLLRYNFGPGTDDSVFIKPAPIADLALSFLRQLYTAMLAQPDAMLQLLGSIDVEALEERLGIPLVPASVTPPPGAVPQTRPTNEATDDMNDLLPPNLFTRAR